MTDNNDFPPDPGPKRDAWVECHLDARLGKFDSNPIAQMFGAEEKIDTAALQDCLKETEERLAQQQKQNTLSLSTLKR